jgi:hypothetical protein
MGGFFHWLQNAKFVIYTWQALSFPQFQAKNLLRELCMVSQEMILTMAVLLLPHKAFPVAGGRTE